MSKTFKSNFIINRSQLVVKKINFILQLIDFKSFIINISQILKKNTLDLASNY